MKDFFVSFIKDLYKEVPHEGEEDQGKFSADFFKQRFRLLKLFCRSR